MRCGGVLAIRNAYILCFLFLAPHVLQREDFPLPPRCSRLYIYSTGQNCQELSVTVGIVEK